MIQWIAAVRQQEARRNAGDPGIVLAHRLSNSEYNYTVRDLTGVDIRPAREFPVDPGNPAGLGWKHDNMKLPVVTAGGLGGTLKTGRSLNYLYAGDENRKLCSLYLGIMDRMGVELDRFGDANTGLADL